MIYYVNSAVLLNLLMPYFKRWTETSDWKLGVHIIDIQVIMEETAVVYSQYCWIMSLLHHSICLILLDL